MEQEMVFTKVNERSRTYHYPEGKKITIYNVVGVHVRPSGTHRLETFTPPGQIVRGRWIVPAGWLAIELDTDEWSF